jgi:hypothetical protein
MNRLLLAALAAVLALAAGCDAGFDGLTSDNRLPETELAVRSTDLREDLGSRRLISTVEVAWSGTDPDGIVEAFEVRAYPVGAAFPAPGPDQGWARTARRDSVMLLPIPLGQESADVAVEVRAIDNLGGVDPTPARTIYPILNSPPALRLVAAEAPADTTWPVISFAFSAADPDGEANLAGVEIALNDTLNGFVRLPADASFVTLVASDPRASGSTSAAVFLGRGFSNAGVSLPGLALDADNTIYLRSVDQAGATSRTLAYPNRDDGEVLYVRGLRSTVVLVNDVRRTSALAAPDPRPAQAARDALALHGTTRYDEWDLSETLQTAAAPQFSAALPATVDPTLRQTIALWSHVYWVSNAVTDSPAGNNLPRVASVADLFFENGGRLLVHVPITLPQSGSVGGDNAAIDVLPMSGLITFPAGVTALRASTGTPVRPDQIVPGTTRTLPPLQAARLLTSTLPYTLGPDDIPLYRLSFYRNNVPTDAWAGSDVVASMRSDRRAALIALPLFAGANPLFAPAPGATEGIVDALAVLLDGLDFPTGSGLASRR